MKKIIVLPRFFLSRHTDNYKFLFRRMKDEEGFDFQYTNRPNLSNYDLVMAYAVPHRTFPNSSVEYLIDLPRSICLVVFARDIHAINPVRLELRKALFERADLILTYQKQQFFEWYGEDHRDKWRWFPQFFADDKRYSMGINPKPKPLFLLSGAVHSKYYPLRYKIQVAEHNKIVRRHSRWFIGDDYAKMLHRFFGMITDCSFYNVALAKIFESLAAGQLLLCNECADVKELGFQAGVHYMDIDEDNWEDKLNLLFAPDSVLVDELMNNIRQEGHKFVHAEHGLENRFQLMKEILAE